MNPVGYFEIPVADLTRAIAFYERVFELTLERDAVDGNEMALFPYIERGAGASGALAKGDSYTPARDGARLYFSVDDIRATLDAAVAAGGEVIYPVTSVGANGWVAEFLDSEGNCIALHSRNAPATQ